MDTENSQNQALKPSENNENNVLEVETVPKHEVKVSEKPSENYTYRGGTAYVGFTQALKLTGTSRATLHRYTQNQKLSFETDEDGHKIYQVVELERVFGKLKSPETEKEVSEKEKRNQLETDLDAPETILKVTVLEERVKHLEEMNRLYVQTAERAEQEAENWRQQAERITLMLTHRPEPEAAPVPETQPIAPEPKKGFFGRLFGSIS